MRLLPLLLGLSFFLASCETIQGVGRDIQNTGEALEDAVDGD